MSKLQTFLWKLQNKKKNMQNVFSYLEGGDVEITAMYPAGKVGTTAENLEAALWAKTKNGHCCIHNLPK